ncbi:MAG: T9SS C-terminal target domain-containing protein [Bacteroidetes bacterium]|nr:MAG: T9SS C-terminal target domain-containing protein [Bacteroidota bacterium]
MKSRNFWAVLCLFALFALPAVGQNNVQTQNWSQKQVIQLPQAQGLQTQTKRDRITIFANNDFLFVGSSFENNNSGYVYVYSKQNGVWNYTQKITPPSDATQFGISIASEGNHLIIASLRSIYLYKKQNTEWLQTQKIQGDVSIDPYVICANGIWPHAYLEWPVVSLKNGLLAFGCIEKCQGVYNTAIRIYEKDSNEIWQRKKRMPVTNINSVSPLYPPNANIIGNNWIFTRGGMFNDTILNMYNTNNCLINNSSINCSVAQSINSSHKDTNFYQEKGVRKAENNFMIFNGSVIGGSPKYLKNFNLINNIWQEVEVFEFDIPNNSAISGFLHTDNRFILQTQPRLNAPYTPIRSSNLLTFRKSENGWIKDGSISLNYLYQNAPNNCFVDIIDDTQIIVSNGNKSNGIEKLIYFEKSPTNIIKGKIYNDLNQNCQKEAGEVGKKYYSIKAEPGNYITSTDENGNYELEVGAGTYTISQVIPQAKGLSVTQLCPAGNGTHTVSFTGLNNEVSGYDFGNQVKECTFLTVDVTARRRRCFRNQTIVKYENEGVASANNAYITVTFPEYVIPLSSTNPWVSKVGNTYKFNVGTLTAGQRGQFVVTDSVACVAGIQGLIQCTEAKIYPKNTCASPTWSGASLEIVGKCLDIAPHKGRFVLRNTGTASMQSSYKVWRGNTLILNNLLTLAQGDSLVLEIPTNNENVFIQANQATGHPDGETVSAMVMNCGNSLPTSAGSPNLQMMILPNDEYANSELDCMPIVDSYDPNDKAVSPAGITENNYVKPNTELEYKIRFQNMGTAEAVNIVVIDTLSQHLDLTTFQMMSASHTYKLKFERVNGKQVAFWTFTDINLPAKSINEPASHGYIKFKIKHLPTIAEGTIIKNFADIYFDYNEPVRTNETAINMTDYQFPVNPVDYCSLFTQAQAGQARTVCGDSYTLEGNSPTMGQGTWTRISGAGEIAEPHKSNSLVTNLGVGENVFRWTLAGVPDCANTQSQVTIKRLPTATVSISNNTSNNIACAEENITFSAQTNNVGNAPVYQWKVNNQNVGTNSPTFNSNTLQNQDKVSVEVQTNLDCINAPNITSQPIEMTIKAKPAKPVISHTALYELKSSVEGNGYAWYKDNVLITNNLPTLKVQKLGKYKVVVTQNGCSSPASDELVLNSEALKRFADLVKVETYPNPTTGKFTLNIINNQGSEVTVQFYNSLGQLLTEQRVEASEDIDCKVSIDFTHYKQGVYYAKIVNQYGLQTTQKIVIQKQ